MAYDQTMVSGNAWYDWIVEAAGKEKLAERSAAFKEISGAMESLSKVYENPVATALNPGGKLILLTYPSWDRAMILADAGRTENDLTVIALALCKYKARKGEYPETLAGLEGDVLKKVPLDRFSEKPLHYERKGDGYMLYSIGTNQRDDGGVWDRKNGKDDLVVKAER